MPKKQPVQISQTVTQELSTLAPRTSTPASASELARKPFGKQGDDLDFLLSEIFSDFETCEDAVLKEMLESAMNFCRAMASGTQPAYWLTLLGKSGTGKTMLARCISRFFTRHLDCLQDERNNPNERYCRRGGFKRWIAVVQDMLEGDYSAVRQLSQDWFLVLDDIGVDYKGSRDLSISKLFEILNARQGLFTVITANISFEDIADKMDTRIASRLLRDGSAIVNVKTKDYNLR